MKRIGIAIGMLLLGLIVAGATGGFLVADYSYQKGYSSGYALGYSKGHFEGFAAGEVVQADLMICDLIERDIAHTDTNTPGAAIIPYLEGDTSMAFCMYPRTDPRARIEWDVSWVYAGRDCAKRCNEIIEIYREEHWAGYIK